MVVSASNVASMLLSKEDRVIISVPASTRVGSGAEGPREMGGLNAESGGRAGNGTLSEDDDDVIDTDL